MALQEAVSTQDGTELATYPTGTTPHQEGSGQALVETELQASIQTAGHPGAGDGVPQTET